MPKPVQTPLLPTFQFDEAEIAALRKALTHYADYLRVTRRDSRIYTELAERLES